MVDTKICNRCHIELSLELFHNLKSNIDGKQPTCKLCRSSLCKRYYINNIDLVKEKSIIYYCNNKDKRVKWENNKLQQDPIFKLKKRLRHRLRNAFYRLKKHRTSGSAIKDLGCSIEYLKKYLEVKFQPGMTWENWGTHGWHIDHIRPLSSTTDEKELIKLCYYTNLQPLWAKDNIRKGGTI